MGTEQQMFLAVAPRASSSHLNRPARQLVPAFLQKLYEMVNDPSDHDLIRWSDTGDSFFVLDQERFASEVLGRWFKHKNFSSFVRQLNMYGFHKIPHLQQGVLRSDSDTEFWNFEHPHFIRGQPDMLCLIQRKKQAASSISDAVAPTAEVSNKDTGSAGAVGALSPGQLMDMNSIVNGIQAIKRHQAAISADLNELKSSNQHLWQEAMAARERHKKHQDTINRILKFLAGVFGHTGEPIRKDDLGGGGAVSGGEGGEIMQRKPQRLMIGDGRSDRGKKGMEVHEIIEDQPRSSIDSAQSSDINFFSSLDTPIVQSEYGPSTNTSPRFASVEPSLPNTPTPAADANTTLHPSTIPANTTNVNANANAPKSTPLSINIASPTPSNPSLPRPAPMHHSVSSPAFTALTTTSPSPPPQNDSLIHAALSQVLSSPAQLQKLIAAIGAGGFSFSGDGHTPGIIPQSIMQQPFPGQPQPQSQSQPQPQPQPQPQFPQHTNPNPNPQQLMPYDPAAFHSDYSGAFSLLSSGGGDLAPFESHDEHLQKSYSSAQEINADVDELQTNIHSLIQSLGIDPTTFDGAGNPQTSLDDTYGSGQDSFDFGSYLNGLDLVSGGVGGHAGQEEDPDMESLRLVDKLDSTARAVVETKIPTEQVHAFLDEVASQDGSMDVTLPLMQTNQDANIPRGRKRKSDVTDVGSFSSTTEATASSAVSGNRSKRKR